MSTYLVIHRSHGDADTATLARPFATLLHIAVVLALSLLFSLHMQKIKSLPKMLASLMTNIYISLKSL